MPFKQVHYDSRSLSPERGDQVEVVIHHQGQEPEIVEAVFMGTEQIYSYTTPYFRFLIGTEVRLVNANAVREWRFTIAPPGPMQAALPDPDVGDPEF